jgi:hypothetical protein
MNCCRLWLIRPTGVNFSEDCFPRIASEPIDEIWRWTGGTVHLLLADRNCVMIPWVGFVWKSRIDLTFQIRGLTMIARTATIFGALLSQLIFSADSY